MKRLVSKTSIHVLILIYHTPKEPVIKCRAFGRIHIFDQSWYERALLENKDNALQEILAFEEQLSNAGYLIIKLFLHISKKEQAQRFKALESDFSTAWRVTDQDWNQNKHYKEWVDAYDMLLIGTDKSYAPWTVIESMDKRYASMKSLVSVTEAMEKAADTRHVANEKPAKVTIAKEDSARVTTTAEVIASTEGTHNFEKQWKITDEDWRNRAKWDDYEEAIDEMIVKTSTTNAPWILVSGNNKYYARIQVLTAVCDAIE